MYLTQRVLKKAFRGGINLKTIMIDTMIRCKNLDASEKIESLCEWFYKCPPQGKEKQWKDGRSAKETAKHWLHTIPQPFKDLLRPFQLTYTFCSPEYVSAFDAYKGNGRNHDLLLLAKNTNNDNVVIGIESKADEPFGDTLSKTTSAAVNKKAKNSNSRALERTKELREMLFGEINSNQLELRYQLLTAVAGTVAEAKKHNATTAFFLIQTFVEKENKKHLQNRDAVNMFFNVFTKSTNSTMENNQMVGPFRIAKRSSYLCDGIDLWIGKYEIEI